MSDPAGDSAKASRGRNVVVGLVVGAVTLVLLGAIWLGVRHVVRTRLWNAVQFEEYLLVDSLLDTWPSLINMRNRNHETCLHAAVEHHDARMVDLLLKHGADPNVDSPRLGLPLNYASGLLNAEDIIIRLLDAGADCEGQSRISLSDRLTPPIHLAALGGCATNVATLIARGANVNSKARNGATPLIKAVVNRQTSINERKAVIDVLLKNGADINATDNSGMTVLDWADGGVDIGDIPDMLVKHGARHSEGSHKPAE